jgi:SNF2 family DNA or RNA helicase
MELSDLQQKAFSHISTSFNNNINPLCALGMGLGKTRVVCKVISEVKEKNAGFRILIATKASLFNNPWDQEMSDCGIIDEHTKVFHFYGKERERYLSESGTYLFEDNIILLTTYDTLVKDIENNRHDMNKPFTLFVVDEIHLFMNSKRMTKRFEVISRLPALRRIALSGTPVQNKKLELGMIYLFLNDPLAFSHCRKIPENSLIAASKTCATNKAMFHQFEGEKGNFNRNEAVLCLPVNPELLAVSKTIKNSKKRLMFLSNPNSLYYQYGKKQMAPDCTKVEAVKIILTVRRSQKVIIFSQFINVLYAYKDMMTSMGMDALVLTGDDKGSRLKEKLDMFEYSQRYNILLTTLQKSSEGLNLSFANHIIILEFWWNPQKIFQAMNRIDRKGQRHDIFIYLLCYHNDKYFLGEEGKLYQTMVKKIEEANAVLQSYADEKNEGKARQLPGFKVFNEISTLQKELTDYLYAESQTSNWWDDECVEEKKGKSISETIEEIKNHPLMRQKAHEMYYGAIQRAIQESNQAEKRLSRNKKPLGGGS